MPPLITERLIVRPFVPDDLEATHRILDRSYIFAGGQDRALTLDERRAWLEWSIAAAEEQGNLFQPPLGDRAVELRATGELIGVCGLTAAMVAPEQLTCLARGSVHSHPYLSPEIGLYYQIAPEHRGQGYATEAAMALVEYAFGVMALERIVATTTFENDASMAVMRKLGMRVDRNPFPEPPWLQVVGVLTNHAAQ